MQYLKPVGFGPSSKTCPKCASHFVHLTSVLVLASELSSCSDITESFIGTKKLGHPHPASNFVCDSNKGSLQQKYHEGKMRQANLL